MSRMERGRRLRRWLWAGAGILVLASVLALGWANFQEGRRLWLKNASATVLASAAAANQGDAELQYTAAFRLWQENRPREALPLAERAAALQPDRAVHQLLMGYLYSALERPAEGLLRYHLALVHDPGLRAAHTSAAQCYVAVGMHDEALGHLRAAWDAARPDAANMAAIVEALCRKGEYREAEARCREMMPYLPPHDVRGFRLLYLALKPVGRGGDVEREMREFHRQNPFVPRADFYAELAHIVLDSSSGDRLAEADRLVRRALEKRPEMGEAYQALGELRAAQGRHAEAAAAFRRALAMTPELPRARRRLGSALRAAGRRSEAEALGMSAPAPGLEGAVGPLRRRVESDPSDRTARLALAEALARGGDMAGAFRACWPLLQSGSPEARAVRAANRALLGAILSAGGES